MRKNVLILSSTPRKKGNSELLCEQFMKGADQAGHSVEIISLRDRNINYCTGCSSCFNRGTPCSQRDDMDEILDKMERADVIVMATPVYFYSMCGQMKTLIDRTCAGYTRITGKEFYFIITAADDTIKAMEGTMVEFRGFTSCLTEPKERGLILSTGVWRVGEVRQKPEMEQAYEMGQNV